MASHNSYRAAVITVSDKGSRGEREDASGALVQTMLGERGYRIVHTAILPDEQPLLEAELARLCDERRVDVILTTGGTGFSPRDRTPEATAAIAHRAVPGIAEAMRMQSMKITRRAMLSRAIAVIREQTLIVNLPGSPKAVRENLEYILEELEHGLGILTSREGECAVPLP